MNNSIAQKLKYKQSIIKFSMKYGVTKASIEFNVNRRTIYRWRERYDGTLESLKDKSHRPKHHPNEHTAEEIKLIKDYKANNKETGLVVLWVKLRRAGYTRTIQGLYHVMIRLGIYKKAPSKRKRKQAPEVPIARYPGERVQIDVKYVPRECMSKELKEIGEKYYQYTAIDEYTRQRVLWASKEHNTYESARFLEVVIKKFKYKIECVQTDNGFEFTNRLNAQNNNKKTMFENKLEELGIRHKLIKPRTPRHNGKVERSHRKDQERFYYDRVFISFEDFKEKLRHWNREYNNFPMKPLGWKSPNEKYIEYQAL